MMLRVAATTLVFLILCLTPTVTSAQIVFAVGSDDSPSVNDNSNDNNVVSSYDLYDDYEGDEDDDGDDEEGVPSGAVDARQLKHFTAHHATPQLIPMSPIAVQASVQAMPIGMPMMMAQQQVQYTDVRRVTSCPSGFDRRGELCITNEVFEPDMMCPPGHQLVDGRCLLFARARKDCPPPFQLSSTGSCSSVEIVPVQYSCPEGTLDDTGRGCRVPQVAGHQCPSGFSMEGNICVQKFPASLQCPDGYDYSHKSCSRTKSFEASPMCPEGSRIDEHGHKCFSMVHSKPKCPKGFKMSKETATCVRKVKRSQSSCPPGFETPSHDIHHAFCEKKIQSAPQLSCPVDAALDPASGQCVSELQGMVSCSDGFQLSRSQDGMCEQIVEEVATCPIGTMAIGHGAGTRCQTSVDHEMIECCPPGFEQVGRGKCERREYFKAVPSCTDCTVVKKVPVQFSCPSEFTSRGSSCSRQMRAESCGPDCSAYSDRLASGGGSLRSGSQDLASIPAECLQPPRDCPPPREEVIPAEARCPSNFMFSGDYCEQRTEQNQEPRCNMGTLDVSAGKCVRVTTVPMKTECSPGSTRVGNRCVHYEEHAPEFSCAPGSVVDHRSGSCVVRTPAGNQRGELIRTPPVAMCSSGSMHDFTCWDVERLARSATCPAGSIPADTHHLHKDKKDAGKYCLVFAELVVPAPHKKFHKASYFCADGRQSHGKKCHHSDKSNPVASCPTGSAVDSVDGHSCVRRMNPVSAQPRFASAVAVPVCPGGTVVQGTKCVATRQVVPEVTCPPGYQLVSTGPASQDCAKVAPMIPVCPVGSTHTPDGCLKEVRAPAIVTTVPLSDCGSDDCY